MPQQSRNFIEDLPLELRQCIYAWVLQRENTVAMASRELRPVDIPLFRASRRIYQESRNMFFEVNTFRTTPSGISTLVDRYGCHLRHICVNGSTSTSSLLAVSYAEALETILASSSLLPKLKRVTFECTGLQTTTRILVEQILHSSDLSISTKTDLRCIAVGRFQLTIPNYKLKLYFTYDLLSTLWETLLQQPHGFDVPYSDIANFYSASGPICVPHWIYTQHESHSATTRHYNARGLAARVATYGWIEDVLPALEEGAQMDCLRRYELFDRWEVRETVLQQCVHFAGRLRLRDVRSEHGSEALEWATELLTPNTRDFARDFGRSVGSAEEVVRRNR